MRPRLGLVLALPLLIALWLAGAGPAAAHDQLVGSHPDAGTDLHTAPASLRLTFSDSVSDTGIAIRVTDAAGTQLQSGKPQIAEDVVTQRLKSTKVPGTVRVVWRVTSADGHPVSGNFKYSINAAAAKKSATSSGPASDATSTATGLQRGSGATSPETSYQTTVPNFQRPTDRTNNEPLLIIGAVVLALLVVGGFAALIRLRGRDDNADL